MFSHLLLLAYSAVCDRTNEKAKTDAGHQFVASLNFQNCKNNDLSAVGLAGVLSHDFDINSLKFVFVINVLFLRSVRTPQAFFAAGVFFL